MLFQFLEISQHPPKCGKDPRDPISAATHKQKKSDTPLKQAWNGSFVSHTIYEIGAFTY